MASRAPICTHVGHLSSAAPKRIVALAYAIGAIEDRADKGNLRVPVMISIRSFFIHCCFSWSVRGEEHGWWRPLCAQWRNACMRAGTSARGPTSTAAASAVSPSVMCLASSKYDHRSSRDAVDPTRAHSDVQGAVVQCCCRSGIDRAVQDVTDPYTAFGTSAPAIARRKLCYRSGPIRDCTRPTSHSHATAYVRTRESSARGTSQQVCTARNRPHLK